MDKINFTQAYGPVVISPEKIANVFNASNSTTPLKISVAFKMSAEYLYRPSSISSQQQLSGMVRMGMGAYEYLKDFEIRRLYFDVDGVNDIKEFEKLLEDMVAYTGVKEYVVTENEFSRHGGLSFHIFFRARMHWLAMRNYVRKYKADAMARNVPCAECIDHLPYMEKQTFRCVYSPNAINRHINYQEHTPDHVANDPYLVELVEAYKKAKTSSLPNGFQEPRDFHFPIMSTYPAGYKKANVFFIQDTRDCQRIVYTDQVNYVVPLDKEFRKMDFLIDDPEYDEIWERGKNQEVKLSLHGRHANAKPRPVPREVDKPKTIIGKPKFTPKSSATVKLERDTSNSKPRPRSQAYRSKQAKPRKPVVKPTVENEKAAMKELKEGWNVQDKTSSQKKRPVRRWCKISEI